MFNDYYNGKRVFVTGHSGFKGSWLSIWLKTLGAKVTGYSLPPNTQPSIYTECKLQGDVSGDFGDIRDGGKLLEAMRSAQPEIVFHLAAQPLVRLSYQDPVTTLETNIAGIWNLFEAVRQVPSVKNCVIITSDKCYENKEWVFGYREVDEMGGFDPYSASKACAEILTSAYRRSYFQGKEGAVNIASVRAGNVIGGGDWSADRLIPDCVRSFSENKNVVLRYPAATRPWQHVLEPLSGYLQVGSLLESENPIYRSAWNFGPALSEVSEVENIVKQAALLWGNGAGYSIDADAERRHEATNLTLDVSKAYKYLGWQQVWDLATTMEKTIGWYRTYYDKKENMKIFTEKQIAEYISDARMKKLSWAE